MMLKKVSKRFFPAIDLNAKLLISAGSLTLLLTMVKSGIVYPFGMGFWGANGHDGVWHIALIRSLARGYWEMPVMAGEQLKNYHVGYDLLLAVLHKLTFIPVNTLYFQILPVILAVGIGIAVYKFVEYWTNSRQKASWAIFFVYFGGSWGWLVNLVRSGNIDGESMYWAQQSISTLINPPFAISLILLFAGLTLLLKGLRNGGSFNLIAATFIFGILVQVKVYAGILVLLGLFAAALVQLLKRKGTKVFKVFSGAVIISILIFSPYEAGSSAVEFRPFFFLDTMMSNADRLNWPKFAEALLNYKLASNWPKLITAYGASAIIFLLGNFGSRIIFLPEALRQIRHYKNISLMNVIIFTVIPAGIAVTFFFVQSGTAWNTIQFMYYSLVFSGVIAGIQVAHFLQKIKNKVLRGVLVIVLVILTIPTTVGTLIYHYLPGRPPAMISTDELEALKFLESQPEGVVLIQPFDKAAAHLAQNNPPRPLYLYESTAYVSAFSDKPVYLEDEVNLEITGYNWQERREDVISFFDNLEYVDASEYLRDRDIKYIYNIRNEREIIDKHQGLHKIFENSTVEILSIW